jgi:hypothetical protein
MEKITEDELRKIELIRQDSLEIASALGELTYQKIVIESQIDQQKLKIAEVKKQEAALFEDFRNKYGNITINIETGEINR